MSNLDPRFHPTSSVKFDQDKYTDLLYNSDGKGFPATIEYEGYYYDGAFRVVKLEVECSLKGDLTEDVINNLHLREGKRIELETSIKYV